MKANKIILNDEVLLDLTKDTVTPEKVLRGEVFHRADGSVGTGTFALQEKVVTDSGEVVPDAGFGGLSKVTVDIPVWDGTVEIV